MADTLTLSAEKRTAGGKGNARKLRAAGNIPAIIYGRGREPQSLTIAAADFERALTAAHGDFKSTVFMLSVEGQETSALIREVQRHPTRLSVTHIDFLEVHAGEKITLEVPVRLLGTAAGVKEGGILDQAIREIEIEVLPRNIPDHLELDVSGLDIGDSLQVSDIGATDFEILTDLESTICSVVPPRIEEEPEEAAEEAEEELLEPEVIGKTKEDETTEEESGEE